MSSSDDDSSRRELSRRRFLHVGAAGVATLGVGCGADGERPPTPTAVDAGGTGGAGGSDGSTGSEGGPGGDASGSGEPTNKATVAIVGATEIESAVRRAIALAGGLDEIRAGQTVFIKPNAVHGSVAGMPGVITGFEVLGAIVRLVKERGARVIVGDRSARQVGTSADVFRQAGITAAMLAAGADEVYPAPRPSDDPSAWVLVQPPRYEETWAAAGGILAMRKIVEADHLIDVPVCKNHRWAAFSLSMKNFIGAIGDDSRDALHFQVADADRLSRDIAILNQPFKPIICVLDALTAIVNGGPEGVYPDRVATSPRLVMASRDRVALDAAGISLDQAPARAHHRARAGRDARVQHGDAGLELPPDPARDRAGPGGGRPRRGGPSFRVGGHRDRARSDLPGDLAGIIHQAATLAVARPPAPCSRSFPFPFPFPFPFAVPGFSDWGPRNGRLRAGLRPSGGGIEGEGNVGDSAEGLRR